MFGTSISGIWELQIKAYWAAVRPGSSMKIDQVCPIFSANKRLIHAWCSEIFSASMLLWLLNICPDPPPRTWNHHVAPASTYKLIGETRSVLVQVHMLNQTLNSQKSLSIIHPSCRVPRSSVPSHSLLDVWLYEHFFVEMCEHF